MRLKTLFAKFIEDCKQRNRKRSTLNKHRLNIEYTLNPILGSHNFQSLRPVDTSKLIEDGNRRGVTMARSVIITLRGIFKFAKRCKIPLPFDIEELELPRENRLRDLEVLTQDEINLIRCTLAVERATYSKYYGYVFRAKHNFLLIRSRCLFEFLLHTGLRLSEALSVNRDDLDLENGELRVKNVKSEIGAQQYGTVYTFGTERIIEEYLTYRTDDDPALFISNNGKRLSFATAQSSLKRIKKMVNLKKNLNHRIFRSTFVTFLLKNGCDVKEVQRLARHKSLITTLNYYYRTDTSLKPKHQAIMSLV